MSRRAYHVRGIGDPALFAVSLLLTGLGIAMIHSAGLVDLASPVTGIWKRQLMWTVVALIAFYLLTRVPVRWVEWSAPWVYALSIALLLLVLAIGSGPNTRSWLYVGAFRMQPAEVAKIGTILMLARSLSKEKDPGQRLSALLRPCLIVLLPFVLVIAQPDLGSAIIFMVILVCALFWGRVPLPTIFMLISPGVSLLLGFSAIAWGIWFLGVAAFLYHQRPFMVEWIAVALANVAGGALTLPLWNHLAPYQQRRLLVFLDSALDPRGAGWHLIQSRVAIGSGGVFGQGYGAGPQKRLAFLPEQHTDFIFSVVGEELGFIGVLLFLALFAWFLRRLLRIAYTVPNGFEGIVVFCLFGVWFSHLVINIGMTVGLMPITGLPLPFLSYGGSFLVTLFIGLGLIQRAAAER